MQARLCDINKSTFRHNPTIERKEEEEGEVILSRIHSLSYFPKFHRRMQKLAIVYATQAKDTSVSSLYVFLALESGKIKIKIVDFLVYFIKVYVDRGLAINRHS